MTFTLTNFSKTLYDNIGCNCCKRDVYSRKQDWVTPCCIPELRERRLERYGDDEYKKANNINQLLNWMTTYYPRCEPCTVIPNYFTKTHNHQPDNNRLYSQKFCINEPEIKDKWAYSLNKLVEICGADMSVIDSEEDLMYFFSVYCDDFVSFSHFSFSQFKFDRFLYMRKGNDGVIIPYDANRYYQLLHNRDQYLFQTRKVKKNKRCFKGIKGVLGKCVCKVCLGLEVRKKEKPKPISTPYELDFMTGCVLIPFQPAQVEKVEPSSMLEDVDDLIAQLDCQPKISTIGINALRNLNDYTRQLKKNASSIKDNQQKQVITRMIDVARRAHNKRHLKELKRTVHSKQQQGKRVQEKSKHQSIQQQRDEKYMPSSWFTDVVDKITDKQLPTLADIVDNRRCMQLVGCLCSLYHDPTLVNLAIWIYQYAIEFGFKPSVFFQSLMQLAGKLKMECIDFLKVLQESATPTPPLPTPIPTRDTRESVDQAQQRNGPEVISPSGISENIDSVTATLAAAAAMFGCASVGKKVYDDEQVGNWMQKTVKTSSALHRLKQGLYSMLDVVKDFSNWIQDLVRELQYKEPTAILQRLIANTKVRPEHVHLTEDFFGKIAYYMNPINNNVILVKSTKSREELHAMLQICYKLLQQAESKEILLTPVQNQIISKAIVDIKTILTEVVKNPNMGDYRKTPFWLYLYGKPGTGKSQVSPRLVKTLVKLLRKDDQTNYEGVNFYNLPEEDNMSYSVNFTDKFMTNYRGQYAVTIDDLFQDTQPLGETSSALNIISWVSNIPHGTNQASLQDKGLPFTSSLIVSTSNMHTPSRNEIVSNDALTRRRGITIEMTGYDKFNIRSRADENQIYHKDLTYKQLMVFIFKAYKEHWIHQLEMEARNEVPDNEVDDIFEQVQPSNNIEDIVEEPLIQSTQTIATQTIQATKPIDNTWWGMLSSHNWWLFLFMSIFSYATGISLYWSRRIILFISGQSPIEDYLLSCYQEGIEPTEEGQRMAHAKCWDSLHSRYTQIRDNIMYYVKKSVNAYLWNSITWMHVAAAIAATWGAVKVASYLTTPTPPKIVCELCPNHTPYEDVHIWKHMFNQFQDAEASSLQYDNTTPKQQHSTMTPSSLQYNNTSAKQTTTSMIPSSLQYNNTSAQQGKVMMIPSSDMVPLECFKDATFQYDDMAQQLVQTSLRARNGIVKIKHYYVTKLGERKLSSATAIRISNTYILANHHIFDLIENNSSDHSFVLEMRTVSGLKTVNQLFDPKRMIRIKDKDAVVYKCDNSMPSARDIVDHFSAEMPIKDYSVLLAARTPDDLVIANLTAHPMTSPAISWESLAGTPYTTVNYYLIKNYCQIGMSGSPCVALDRSLSHKILGIQTCISNQSKTFIEPISCKELRVCIQQLSSTQSYTPDLMLDDVVQASSCTVSVAPADLGQKGLWHIGKLQTSVPSSKKTRLRPSVLQPSFPPEKIPAALTRADPRITNPEIPLVPLPYYRASTFDRDYGAVNMREMDEVTNSLIDEYKNLDGDISRRILTNDEMINGCTQYIKPFDKYTSPGYPWVSKRKDTKLNGKWEFFNRIDENTYTMKEELEEAFLTAEQQMLDGERPPFLAYYCLKDELLKPQKVEDGRTRGFICLDMTLNLIARKYFGAFTAMTRKHAGEIGPCVGIDPGKGWTELYYRLLEKSAVNWQDFDYTNWDTSVHPQLFWEYTKIVNAWYDDCQENQRLRFVVASLLTYTPLMIQNHLFVKTGGMPSGCAITADANSLINEILIYYVYRLWCGDTNKPYLKPLYIFRKNVGRAIYGDDLLLSNSEELKGFDGNSIAKYYDELGMSITSAKKTREFHYSLPSEVTFLKRSFRKEEKSKIVKPPLDKISMLSPLSWIHKSEDPVRATKDNVLTVLREATYWGREYYNSLRVSIIESAQYSSTMCYMPLPSFDDMEAQVAAIPMNEWGSTIGDWDISS